MTKNDKAFIKDNKERLSKIFQELYDSEKNNIFSMPKGIDRDIRIEFVRFLDKWLYNIEIFSKVEKPEDKSFI